MPGVCIPRRSSSINSGPMASPGLEAQAPTPGEDSANSTNSNRTVPAAEEAPGSVRGSTAASRGSPSLAPSQLHALFDILTHYHTYAEIQSFKHPSTMSRYGRPFALNPDSPASERNYASESSAPLLASFLKSVVLPLPGVRDLSSDFWSVRLQGILVKLAEAELSESYDKGALGTRKTLATVASVVQETVVRGILGGFPGGPKRDLGRSYDTSSAQDLSKAWEDAVHELVYGDLVDELFDYAIHKNSLEDHSPAVKTASNYVIIQ
jgi:hypothetical protein